MSTNILITGSNGFLGGALHKKLSEQNFKCIGVTRKEFGSIEQADIGQILKGIDVVIHTAARVHITHEHSSNPLQEFQRINVEGTLNIARQAAESGVKRFIFISSIGVNGSTTTSQAFTEDCTPAPHSLYAMSKWQAEEKLKDFCHKMGMEFVIIRPPLIYALHAPGNFSRLIKIIKTGMPLPFGLINNKRSYIALENLVDFINLCILHPLAANETFLISDNELLSTKEVVKIIAKSLKKNIFLVPIPAFLINLGATLLRKKALYEQLCGSLEIDASKASKLLDWKPKQTMLSTLTRESHA